MADRSVRVSWSPTTATGERQYLFSCRPVRPAMACHGKGELPCLRNGGTRGRGASCVSRERRRQDSPPSVVMSFLARAYSAEINLGRLAPQYLWDPDKDDVALASSVRAADHAHKLSCVTIKSRDGS